MRCEKLQWHQQGAVPFELADGIWLRFIAVYVTFFSYGLIF